MLGYDPVPFLHYRPQRDERQEHSFYVWAKRWYGHQEYYFFGDVTGYYVRDTKGMFVTHLRGHITTQRVILEFPQEISDYGVSDIVITVLGAATGALGGMISRSIEDARAYSREAGGGGSYIAMDRSRIDFAGIVNGEFGVDYCWFALKDAPTKLGLPFAPGWIDAEGESSFGASLTEEERARTVREFRALLEARFPVNTVDFAPAAWGLGQAG